MSGRPVIEARGLGKRYQLGRQTRGRAAWLKNLLRRNRRTTETGDDHIWALKNIDLAIDAGERVAILGRNGAGKSTLLKILSRVAYPTEGEARLRGRVTSLLEVGTGFNDNLTGRENVYLNASFHGVGREEMTERMDEIIDFAEIGRFIDTAVKFYSSGMRARLAFAVAAHLDPDILMLDEVLSVGDMGFQQKCLERMRGLTGGDRTLLFVSHSIDAIHRFCDRAIWLDGGEVRADGDVAEVTSAYAASVLAVRPVLNKDDQASEDKRSAAETTTAEPDGDRMQPTRSSPRRPAETLAVAHEARTAHLLNAQVIDADGKPATVLAVERSIGVAFRFETGGEGVYVPAISLSCPDGGLVFWSVPAWAEIERYRLPKGTHDAEVWLPDDILNIGVYSLTIAVVDPSFAPMRRYFVAERALSFQTVSTPASSASARGILPRDFPGPLRPKLDWSLTPATDLADHRKVAP